MAFKISLIPESFIDTVFYRDPAFDLENIPDDALGRYMKTSGADYAGFPLKNGEKPTIIRYRALRMVERSSIYGMIQDAEDGTVLRDKVSHSDYRVLVLMCFRAAVSFPNNPEMSVREYSNQYHFSMLSEDVMKGLVRRFSDEVWLTLGAFVLQASNLTEDQKKRDDSSGASG